MIETTMSVAQAVASGATPQLAMILSLLQGNVVFAKDGIGADPGRLYKYDGEIRYDGAGRFGSVLEVLYNVVSVSPIEEGEVGVQLTVSALESRRTTFVVTLDNSTGEIGDMMASESFVGKDAKLILAWPGVDQNSWPIKFTGEVSRERLTDDRAEIELRTA